MRVGGRIAESSSKTSREGSQGLVRRPFHLFRVFSYPFRRPNPPHVREISLPCVYRAYRRRTSRLGAARAKPTSTLVEVGSGAYGGGSDGSSGEFEGRGGVQEE